MAVGEELVTAALAFPVVGVATSDTTGVSVGTTEETPVVAGAGVGDPELPVGSSELVRVDTGDCPRSVPADATP